MSTLSKRVRPLITLSFNHPKPTKGLDALSRVRTQRLQYYIVGIVGEPGEQEMQKSWMDIHAILLLH